MTSKLHRRGLLRGAAGIALSHFVPRSVFGGSNPQPPSERIRIACLGTHQYRGAPNIQAMTKIGEIAAICDVDDRLLAAIKEKYPAAKTFNDFRKMLEAMDKEIDAVEITTPDHTHAVVTLMAMRMGKHVFCEKPLTRTIYEARLVAQVARQMKVATQTGTQGNSMPGFRSLLATLQAGALGTITEIHASTPWPRWPQGIPRPAPEPCPEYLHWDLWLGPAPERPYARGYHPYAWRGWWDFGTGALGNQASHQLNHVFAALDLRNLVAVQAETSGHNRDSFPKWSKITYEFAATPKRPALKLFWYDGGKTAPAELFEGGKPLTLGTLIVGTKGMLESPGWLGSSYRLRGVEQPKVKPTHSPGLVEEWAEAIRGGPPAFGNFPDHAGPLTEMFLAGNLAVWAANEPGLGPRIEWDAPNMRAKNVAGLETLIKPTYRKGYVLDV